MDTTQMSLIKCMSMAKAYAGLSVASVDYIYLSRIRTATIRCQYESERYLGNKTSVIHTSAGILPPELLPAGEMINVSSNGTAMLAHVGTKITRTTYVINYCSCTTPGDESTFQRAKLVWITFGVLLTRSNDHCVPRTLLYLHTRYLAMKGSFQSLMKLSHLAVHP